MPNRLIIENPRVRAGLEYRLLIAFIGLVFLLGGSARGDVPGLLVLRPIAIGLMVFALIRLSGEQIRQNKGLLSFAGATLLIVAVQLVPLPPWLWHQLPGRQLVQDVDQVFSLGSVWRPITMTPFETQSALFALFVPGAVLALGLHLTHRELKSLVIVLLALGGISMLLGLLQMQSAPQSALYFYNISNTGSPIGFFANRNHQALLIAALIPILAYVSVRRDAPPLVKLAALLSGALILIFLLVLGSRMGLILFSIAVLMLPFLAYQQDQFIRRIGPWRVPRYFVRLSLLVSGGLLFALVVNLNRALAWERLNLLKPDDDARTKILPTLLEMISHYWPIGTGWGSFERLYQIHEPDELLSPTYMNHAHNDWLEVLLNGGLPVAAMIVICAVVMSLQAWKAFGSTRNNDKGVMLARVGILVILLAAVASLSDYPLRTPIGAMIAAIALLWVVRGQDPNLATRRNSTRAISL